MNLIDGDVTKLLSEPYKESFRDTSWWAVDVEYEDDGGTSITKLTFSTEEEANMVDVGYTFLH